MRSMDWVGGDWNWARATLSRALLSWRVWAFFWALAISAFKDWSLFWSSIWARFRSMA